VKGKAVCVRSTTSLQEPACHIGSHKSYLPPDRGSISSPYPGRYSINPPIKDEGLSRPEPIQANRLAKCHYRSACYTRCQLVQLAFFCPTRHGRCKKLVHSCYTATGFSEPVSFKYELNTLSTWPTTLLCLCVCLAYTETNSSRGSM